MNWLNTSARWPSPTSSPRSLEQHVDLGRRHVRVRLGRPAPASRLSWRSRVSDRRIVNRLLVQVVDQAEDLLPLPLQVRLVDPLVLRVELDLEHLLLLGRQLRRDAFLGAAQHQRPDPPTQLAQPIASLPRSIGPAVVLGEPVRDREKPRRRDREQRPQVHQAVLQRRAGDRQLERRRQPAGALVGLGLVVLDELGLVEDQP